MKPAGIYFPNLDGVRAFACLSVFVAHMYDYINNRQLCGIEIWIYDHLIKGAGAMGVCLFFVLSGFLITYLLIREKDARGKIHLGYFYMKRILRIWPLYFLVTITGFFLVPLVTGGIDWTVTKQHLPWFVGFVNNFDRVATDFKGTGNDSLGVLWSVAVEEQFYLLWPLLLLVLNRKTFPFIAAAIIILSGAFRYLHRDSINHIYYHSLSVSGDLAMGGLVAYFGFYSAAFRNFFFNMKSMVRNVMYVLLIVIIANHFKLLHPGTFTIFGRLILCTCFAWIIGDQCFSSKEEKRITRLPLLVKMGAVSYGFYCFHMFIIMGFQKLNVFMGYTKITAWLFYAEFIGAFLVTFAVSALSFRFFEGWFLKHRSRFDIMAKTVTV